MAPMKNPQFFFYVNMMVINENVLHFTHQDVIKQCFSYVGLNVNMVLYIHIYIISWVSHLLGLTGRNPKNEFVIEWQKYSPNMICLSYQLQLQSPFLFITQLIFSCKDVIE